MTVATRYDHVRNLLLAEMLLIVSPHLDDACFSCAALLDRGPPATVLNVFSGAPEPPVTTDWDKRCGFQDSTTSIATRKREDDRAFAPERHESLSLDLLQADYVGGRRDPSDAATIGAAIRAWAEDVRVGCVALPAGAGSLLRGRALRARARLTSRRAVFIPRHPDHLFVRDTGLVALRHLSHICPVLYEELPYSLSAPADREVRSVARRLKRQALELRLSVDRAVKARRNMSYASQVRVLRPNLADPAALPAVERYWSLHRS